MECTLIGVKRGEFTNDDGDKVKFGHLFVVSDFDDDVDGVAGKEGIKVRFDYDAVGDLLGLTFPQQVDLQLNLKGKCTKVILKKNDNNGK